MDKKIGPYELIEELGKGGMGTVYRARHQETAQEVALKVLPPALARETHFVLRFRREIATLRQLDHPNIARILDTGQDNDLYYYAMEFIAGKSLEETIASQGRFENIQEAIEIIRQVARALAFAHTKGIVHRDIKPANILLDVDGPTKLTDFGIAKAIEATRMTNTGAVIGTAEYMAPEQAEGHTVDKRTDMYSLGVVAYRMLTGRLPFTGTSSVEIMKQHRFNIPDAPKSYNTALTNNLSEAVLKMLEKDPRERFESMDALIHRLDQIDDQMTRAEELDARSLEEKPAPKRAVRPAPAHHDAIPWAKVVAYCACFAVVVLVIAWWYASGPAAGSPEKVLENARFLIERRSYAEALDILADLVADPDTPENVRSAAEEDLRDCRQRLLEKELGLEEKQTERARQELMDSAQDLAAAGAYYRALTLLEADHADEARPIFAAIIVLFPETGWKEKAETQLKAMDLTPAAAPASQPATP